MDLGTIILGDGHLDERVAATVRGGRGSSNRIRTTRRSARGPPQRCGGELRSLLSLLRY